MSAKILPKYMDFGMSAAGDLTQSYGKHSLIYSIICL
jgi:hypothetical protein